MYSIGKNEARHDETREAGGGDVDELFGPRKVDRGGLIISGGGGTGVDELLCELDDLAEDVRSDAGEGNAPLVPTSCSMVGDTRATGSGTANSTPSELTKVTSSSAPCCSCTCSPGMAPLLWISKYRLPENTRKHICYI